MGRNSVKRMGNCGGSGQIGPALLFFLLLLMSFSASAQNERFYIRLSGLVTDFYTADPLRNVLVRVLKDSLPHAEVITTKQGFYEFQLDRGALYTVWFSRDDLVTKHVRIDARDVPVFPDVPFYEMDVQMTMFPWIEGMDYSLFDQALGEASYKHSVRNLSWNVEYTERLRPHLAEAMKTYDKLQRKYKPSQQRKPPVDRL
ncbi:MAG: hypothetical protein KDB88_14150 [Flavobacteriales bacterium]|nr:hypothetical protein [Flavobacteriales bacterium]